MKQTLTLLLGLALVAVIAVAVAPVMGATTPSPSRVNPRQGTTGYFGGSEFPAGDSISAVDTLEWEAARGFTDTAAYDVAVFVTGCTAEGALRAEIVNDSAIAVYSAAADSGHTYWYAVWLKKK
jgi:hypothetical protein